MQIRQVFCLFALVFLVCTTLPSTAKGTRHLSGPQTTNDVFFEKDQSEVNFEKLSKMTGDRMFLEFQDACVQEHPDKDGYFIAAVARQAEGEDGDRLEVHVHLLKADGPHQYSLVASTRVPFMVDASCPSLLCIDDTTREIAPKVRAIGINLKCDLAYYGRGVTSGVKLALFVVEGSLIQPVLCETIKETYCSADMIQTGETIKFNHSFERNYSISIGPDTTNNHYDIKLSPTPGTRLSLLMNGIERGDMFGSDNPEERERGRLYLIDQVMKSDNIVYLKWDKAVRKYVRVQAIDRVRSS